jgi:hypothetical protein
MHRVMPHLLQSVVHLRSSIYVSLSKSSAVVAYIIAEEVPAIQANIPCMGLELLPAGVGCKICSEAILIALGVHRKLGLEMTQ